MARLLFDNPTQTVRPYPREDDEPVWGLDRVQYRVLALVELPHPDHDPATESVSPTETIAWDSPAPDCDGTLTRGWLVQPIEPPAPPQPSPDWLGFAGWLYGFSPMMDAMNAARASHDPQGEPATTGLPAALQEARAGNTVAFALSWAQFLAASSMQPSDLAEIIAKAATCNLPPEFVAALEGP